MSVDPPSVRTPTTVLDRYASFDIEPYVVVDGMAQAAGEFLIDAMPDVFIGEPVATPTYPPPNATSLDATARWLPERPSFVDGVAWQPRDQYGLTRSSFTWTDAAGQSWSELGTLAYRDLVGAGTYVVSSKANVTLWASGGAAPQLLRGYTYWRDQAAVRNPAVSLRDGEYFYTDDLAWDTDELTVLMVAVLRRPVFDWYSVLETGPGPGANAPWSFGVRYHRSGVASLWAGTSLTQIDVSAGITRPNQPVVIGFNMDVAHATASLLVTDEALKVSTVSIPFRVPAGSRLFLGRAPTGQQGSSSIDILDVAYFRKNIAEADLSVLMSRMDRMYGVSTS